MIKKILIKLVKNLILLINKILGPFKLIIVPLHYYTPLTELKIVSNHKLLDKVDFSKINYNQHEALIYLNTLKKNIKHFTELNHYNLAKKKECGKGYGYIESIMLQSIISKIKPKKILEIGSGISTFCMLQALKDLNYEFEMLIIDPFINKKLKFLLKDYSNISIIKKKVEDVDIRYFLKYKADFLFIDTSHAVKPLGDVDFIYNRLLPITKNCIIHIHDIYFPYLYQSNLKENPWYQWSETQMLYCYLMNNSKSKIILDTSELFHNKRKILMDIFPNIQFADFEKGLRVDKEKDKYKPSSIYLKQ